MVQIKDTSNDLQTTEMVISYTEFLGLMNLMGIDTTGVSKIHLKTLKANGREIELPTGDMVSGDSLSFRFSGLDVATDTTTLTITGITFS